MSFREVTGNVFRFVPVLPAALKRAGAAYTVGPLTYGAGRVTLTYAIPAAAPDGVEVTLTLVGPWTRAIAVEDSERRQVAEGTAGGAEGIQLRWRGNWQWPFTVTVE